MNASARIPDLNGWYEVKRNPFSKVGVFPYAGSQLPDAPDPGRTYQVYRPAEELGDAECLASFRLLPLTDEHDMLGPSEQGLMPVEEKGAHGTIGEEIEFDGTYIRGNLKVWSEALANLIVNNKKELSAGYRSRLDWTPGMYEGVPYDAVQRDIRANHLALVREGRMGPDVAVLDHYCFTIDSMEHVTMADEKKTDSPEGDLASMKAAIEAMAPKLAELEEIKAMIAKLGAPAAAEGETELTDEEKAAAETAKAMDAEATAQFAAMDKRMKATEARIALVADGMDVKAVLAHVQKRDKLVAQVQPFIGVFDSALMTCDEVAVYAVDKLGLTAAKGTEESVLSGYLHGRTPSAVAHTHDSAAAGSLVANYLAGK